MRSILVIILAMLAQPALAEEPYWFDNQFDATTALVYGLPDTDYAPLLLRCEQGDADVVLLSEHDLRNLADGVEMPLILSTPAQSLTFPATGYYSELTDMMSFQANAPLDRHLMSLLQSGPELMVQVGDNKLSYPLENIAKGLDALQLACGAGRSETDLEIRITNGMDIPITGFLYSEPGVNDFNGDLFGNRQIAPRETLDLILPDAQKICTYDIMVEFSDEEDERDPVLASHNFCEKAEMRVSQ